MEPFLPLQTVTKNPLVSYIYPLPTCAYLRLGSIPFIQLVVCYIQACD